MEIIPLKEGDFFVNKKKEFRLLEEGEISNDLKIAIQPFLIKVHNEYIMLDCGLGWLCNDKPVLLHLLEKINIQPTEISRILISHLHKDHIGGLGIIQNNYFLLNFPQATIYVQQREFEYANSQKQSLSYDFKLIEALKNNSAVHWLNADSGHINDYIKYQVTGGHTPYHQAFWIKNSDTIAFYGADNLPASAYLNYDIAYKSDYDGKKAKQQRINWKQEALQYNWKILFYHDLKTPVTNLTAQ
ncbi:MBL fold metallo-hydrolase [Apibacter sp. HY039]|uniref:MBL fold metallo-hydrolase n=1 Tax=Apibacter sp. HY039 TaxID=2501476 RepID=UPI000FEC1A12|nr:MBL fold metallo-hydrolase [Apibacter sp. HY039]